MKTTGMISLFASALLALSGCASVTIDAANDFLKSADTVTQAITDASADTVKSRNGYKAAIIAFGKDEGVKDGAPANHCDIGFTKTYLRVTDYPFVPSHPPKLIKIFNGNQKSLLPLLEKNYGGAVPEACRRIQECEADAHRPGCSSLCFSAEESLCLNTLEGLYTSDKTAKDLTGTVKKPIGPGALRLRISADRGPGVPVGCGHDVRADRLYRRVAQGRRTAAILDSATPYQLGRRSEDLTDG